ncbi:MAG TPA: hypothetical protein VMT14_18805, partial [Burkholderiaceae bacterium]|nr:hypothetical protein [Burkholderiaceae bacterium]
GLNAHTRLLEKMASMFLPPAVAILAQVQTALKQTAVSGAFCLGLSDICPSRETMSRATPI